WLDEFPGYKFSPGTAALFKRYLSSPPPGWLRSLQGVKNLSTQIELASAFHATTMTNEALTQGYGYGVGRAWNTTADFVNRYILGKDITPSSPPNTSVLDDFARGARAPRDMYNIGDLFIKSRPGLLFGAADPEAVAAIKTTLRRLGVDADSEIEK